MAAQAPVGMAVGVVMDGGDMAGAVMAVADGDMAVGATAGTGVWALDGRTGELVGIRGGSDLTRTVPIGMRR
jgi:hypothetical protein